MNQKLTNYLQFKEFLNKYNIYNNNAILETTLHEASYDNKNKVYVYDETRQSLNVLDFDCFAQRIYLRHRIPHNKIIELAKNRATDTFSLASVDAFLIDREENWYFIEFKNSDITKDEVKYSVTSKAYQNLFWLTDLFKSSKMHNKPFFDWKNPIEFARNKITYILVFSDKDNESQYQKAKDLENANDHLRTKYLEKLQYYVFKDAYAYPVDLFESNFVKKFVY